MTARHSTLFTLGSGQSGLGFYTTQRDAAAESGNAWDGEIKVEVVQRALSICNFYLAQFDAIQAEMGAGDLPADVAAFLRKVKETGSQKVSVAEVRRWRLWGRRNRSKSEILSFLHEVADTYGHGEVVQGRRRDSWIWQARNEGGTEEQR